MTDRTDHSTESTSLSLAALLRLAADGELSAEQERRLESMLEAAPDTAAAARIEAEQHLRAAIGRALGGEPASAPAGLRDRVAAAMAAEPLGYESLPHDQDVPTRLAPATRDRSFWSGAAVTRLTAAAALVALGLIAGVLVLGPQGASDEAFASRSAAVQFVAREHGRCIVDLEPGAGKFQVTDTSMLPGFAQSVIGREVAVADLVAGGVENVAFIDAGPCGVPRGGRSMHLRFDVPLEPGLSTRVSLFVQEYTGGTELREDTTYELDPSAISETDLKSPTVYTWLKDGLVYYLVIDKAEACESIREQLAAPVTVRPLDKAA
ncbi:MAG: hypothetical protein AAGB48_01375 [Planctomycetota bacterium]